MPNNAEFTGQFDATIAVATAQPEVRARVLTQHEAGGFWDTAIADLTREHFVNVRERPAGVLPERERASLEDVRRYIAYLKEFGLDVVLAGGACRDLFHDKTPKDFDLFVLNQNNPQEIANTLSRAGLWHATTHHVPLYGPEGERNPEFDGVIKTKIGRSDVDLVLWKEPVSTAEEVVERFDLSLNQYWMDEEGEICFKEDAPHLIGYVKVLENASPTRTNRILRKFNYNL